MYRKIYCLGDSNTYGFDPGTPFGDRYEKTFCDLLGETLGCRIYADGVNGRSIQDVLHSYGLLRENLQKQQPDLLIVLLGSNDILMDGIQEPSEIAERMDLLLQQIKHDFEDLPLFLLSPPDIRIPGPWRDTVKELSAHYQSLSLKFGTRFLALPGLSLPLAHDGVHFTEEGHKELASILGKLLSM